MSPSLSVSLTPLSLPSFLSSLFPSLCLLPLFPHCLFSSFPFSLTLSPSLFPSSSLSLPHPLPLPLDLPLSLSFFLPPPLFFYLSVPSSPSLSLLSFYTSLPLAVIISYTRPKYMREQCGKNEKKQQVKRARIK